MFSKLTMKILYFYIGDVAGHGVLAAILTMFAYQNIKAVGSSENNGNASLNLLMFYRIYTCDLIRLTSLMKCIWYYFMLFIIQKQEN